MVVLNECQVECQLSSKLFRRRHLYITIYSIKRKWQNPEHFLKILFRCQSTYKLPVLKWESFHVGTIFIRLIFPCLFDKNSVEIYSGKMMVFCLLGNPPQRIFVNRYLNNSINVLSLYWLITLCLEFVVWYWFSIIIQVSCCQLSILIALYTL